MLIYSTGIILFTHQNQFFMADTQKKKTVGSLYSKQTLLRLISFTSEAGP